MRCETGQKRYGDGILGQRPGLIVAKMMSDAPADLLRHYFLHVYFQLRPERSNIAQSTYERAAMAVRHAALPGLDAM